MRKIIYVVIITAFVLSGAFAYAETKIGFIDMKEIVFKSDAGKKAAADLEKIAGKKKTQIQGMEDELKKVKDELDKQRLTLTESALKDKEADYQAKFKNYKRFIEDANEEMKQREQEVFQTLIPEILKVVSSMGESDNYTMVLDVGSMNMPYYSKQLDITKKVIEKYNKDYAAKKK